MAKVIRNTWVYKKHGKWHRYLPRRVDGPKEHDYAVSGGSLTEFKLAIEKDASKLSQATAFADALAQPGSGRRESHEVSAVAEAGTPSKLWLAWVYREPSGEPKWTKKHIENCFGADWKVGRMEIFKNTAATNEDLWKIKHLIELRPVTFVNGEPNEGDVMGMKISSDGRVEVAAEGALVGEEQLRLADRSKHFTEREMSTQLARRYFGFKDIFEANVYTPSNITQIQ